jgi:hypothetical protein
MVDHDVIDPVIGLARRVTGDRREADDLTIALESAEYARNCRLKNFT